jgi:hypothetical protein
LKPDESNGGALSPKERSEVQIGFGSLNFAVTLQQQRQQQQTNRQA